MKHFIQILIDIWTFDRNKIIARRNKMKGYVYNGKENNNDQCT